MYELISTDDPAGKICLVLVTYNRYEVLLGTISSIHDQVRQPNYFIVVDNSSTDGTFDKLNPASKGF